MKSFEELCQDVRVIERLIGTCPNQTARLCLTWDCENCTKSVTLDFFWTWWLEVCNNDDWILSFYFLDIWIDANNDLEFPKSLEHALLACILEKLDGEKK